MQHVLNGLAEKGGKGVLNVRGDGAYLLAGFDDACHLQPFAANAVRLANASKLAKDMADPKQLQFVGA